MAYGLEGGGRNMKNLVPVPRINQLEQNLIKRDFEKYEGLARI